MCRKFPSFCKPHAQPPKINEGHLQSWDHSRFRNLAEVHYGLELVAWAHDATLVPVASEFVRRVFGTGAFIALETGLFRRLFPYWGFASLPYSGLVRAQNS
jgi:hypothetical protein